MANFDYKSRLDALKSRRQDGELIKAAQYTGKFDAINESYNYLEETDSVKYAIGAMTPVDAKYTMASYSEGDRIKNQLLKLNECPYFHNLEFKYQGSVTNNTHIKYHSDIDLLTITQKFYKLEYPLKPTVPYTGDPVKDLVKLRHDCYSLLYSAFPAVQIDNTGAKSISLKGGSLKRKIDVVPSSWFNTAKYATTNYAYHRGIAILDNKNESLLYNTPFYHNKLLDDKDECTHKNYKRVVRLLKTLKADAATSINLSSYDIAALMYHMDKQSLIINDSPLLLIKNSLDYLKFLFQDDAYRNNLSVPDGSRTIFSNATKADLDMLMKELSYLYVDIVDELHGNIEKRIIA